MQIKPALARLMAICLIFCASGCCHSRSVATAPSAGATPLTTQPADSADYSSRLMPVVDALVDPPVGWAEKPLRADVRHVHASWISPSGDTAYGVILINLPLPVGPEMVLWGFLNKLRETDQEGELHAQTNAPDLPGLRFIAESGQYLLNVSLTVRGWHAWAVYAGSLKSRPINARELEMAQRARDHTRVALPGPSASAQN